MKMGPEDQIQADLFEWATWASTSAPVLELLFAVPNGGKRHKVTAARMKATGTKAGVPDVLLPVTSYGDDFIGLALELKAPRSKSRVSVPQRWWLDALAAEGWRCAVVTAWDEAAEIICDYRNLPASLRPGSSFGSRLEVSR